VVIGAEAGASAAHLLKTEAPSLDVTLIETIQSTPSFFPTSISAGPRDRIVNHGYQGLRALGIKVVQGTADDAGQEDQGWWRHAPLRQTGVARHRHQVRPIPGYSREAAPIMPHAYNTALDGVC
jgi:hypothetical protein